MAYDGIRNRVYLAVDAVIFSHPFDHCALLNIRDVVDHAIAEAVHIAVDDAVSEVEI